VHLILEVPEERVPRFGSEPDEQRLGRAWRTSLGSLQTHVGVMGSRIPSYVREDHFIEFFCLEIVVRCTVFSTVRGREVHLD